MSSARSDHPTLGFLPPPVILQPRSGQSTANNSPTDPTGGSLRSPFGNAGGLTSGGKMTGSTRSGAGSPSHEIGGRFVSKR
jgi:protein JSN1